MMKLPNLAEAINIAIPIGILLLVLSGYPQAPTRHIGSNNNAANETVIAQINRSSNNIKIMAEPDKQETSVSHVYF